MMVALPMPVVPARIPETLVPATAPPETAALTAAMATGSAVAVEQFYRHYFRLLYTEARRATRRDEAFCLDVVQDATLRIIRNIRPVDSQVRLMAWLKLVVRTTALDLLRTEKRRRIREASIVPSDAGFDTDQAERIAWLRGQIASLDPQLLRIIEWRFDHRWTLAKIAGTLGLSVATIDGRLRRALKQLGQTAREDFDE
jgi:RNA polymerase sigma factor (sigma-70 family)